MYYGIMFCNIQFNLYFWFLYFYPIPWLLTQVILIDLPIMVGLLTYIFIEYLQLVKNKGGLPFLFGFLVYQQWHSQKITFGHDLWSQVSIIDFVWNCVFSCDQAYIFQLWNFSCICDTRIVDSYLRERFSSGFSYHLYS